MSEPDVLVSFARKGRGLAVFLDKGLVTEEVEKVVFTKTSCSIVLADGRELLAWERDESMTDEQVKKAQADLAQRFGGEDDPVDEPSESRRPPSLSRTAADLTGVDKDVYEFLARERRS